MVGAFGFAIASCLIATSNITAQIAMPSQGVGKDSGANTAPAVKPFTPAGPVSQMPVASGRQLVADARTAMAAKDLNAAVSKYQQAAALAPNLSEIVPDVARLRLDLQLAGVSAEQLTAKPAASESTSVKPLTPIASANPITAATSDTATRKTEALRLIAIGRAALDRGDATTALQYARRAQALKVPDQSFAAGEPRVWQFALDAESAARRSGISLADNGNAAKSGVVTAGGIGAQDEASMIKQMLFQDINTQSGSKVQQVQAEEVYTEELAAQGSEGDASYGKRLYYAGLDALQAGDHETARTRFTQAWEYESQLDLSIRRQLKDKLTLLHKPKRLGAGTPVADTPIARAELIAQEKTQSLYREISKELAKINETNKTSPLDALDQLNRLRRYVDNSDVSEDARRSLGVMVDRALAEQKKYVEANRAEIELDLRNDTVRAEMAAIADRNARLDEEIAALVDSYNDLMDERRYSEAEVVAKQVWELKPGSQIATQMVQGSRMGTRRLINEEIAAGKERVFNDNMLDIDRAASEGFYPGQPMTMPDPRTWRDLTLRRMQDRNEDARLSSAEREIKRMLDNQVKVSYKNQPLAEVVDDLSKLTGVPIVIDNRALEAIRVTPTDTVTLDVPNGIRLESALNLILRQRDLTFDLDNDVLSITSIEAKRTKVYPITYRVTDLVTPIPNFTSSYEDGLAGALRAAYQMSNPQTDVQIMPVSMTDLASGAANSMQPSKVSNPTMLGQYSPMGSQGGFGPSNPPMSGRGGGGSFADFGSLMSLIETTVVPDTWEALGGPSTMAPYPQNLSLVISTTSDVHDQINDLLESLRALQNLQITIEVRFITLSDTFFEQIGVDFDVQFDDNTTNLPDEDAGPGVTIGWDGIGGLPTADLDITFNNNSFGVTPPFGAPDAGAISSIGFAILSDIEAFFFLQAAQGDNRNNVMQAPKVTLFDGQIATISDVTQRPFVTSITPVVGDFAVAQQPVIVVLNEGTQLNVQGIVSDDKRFVRLTLVPFFSQIGDVNTFTYEGRRNTRNTSRTPQGDTDGDGDVDEDDAAIEEDDTDIIEGTTVQLPTFAFTQVSTTVSVPDGGTILLGGIKRLAEGRAERGVPMLSKIPYLSRLFRNVAVGRDARSLMLMVTPRIIIQEEEEVAQTGFEVR